MNGGMLANELSASRPTPQAGRSSALLRQRAARSVHLPGVSVRLRSQGAESVPLPA